MEEDKATLGTRGFFSSCSDTDTSGEAARKKPRFRAGHNRDMTNTENRARKTSGTQGKVRRERLENTITGNSSPFIAGAPPFLHFFQRERSLELVNS